MLCWGSLSAMAQENGAEHVSVLLLESMLKFGFANKCDFNWVALGRAALGSLLISTIPLSETQSLEFVPWRSVRTLQSNGC